MPDLTQVLDDTSLTARRHQRTRTLIGMIAGLVVIVAIAIGVGLVVIDDRETDVLSSLEERSELRAGSRADTIETWIEGMVRLTAQPVTTNTLRLYITDLILGSDDPELSEQLLLQSDYIVDILADFVDRNTFASAHAVDTDGRLLISSDRITPAPATATDLAGQVVSDGVARFTPVRSADGRLIIDLVRPIPELQNPDPTQEPRPIAALIVTFDITDRLVQFLSPGVFAAPGERFALVQAGQEVRVFSLEGGVVRTGAQTVATPLPFAERDSAATGVPVFSSGVAVAGIPWTMVAETDRTAALAPLNASIRTVAGAVVLVTLMVVGIMIAVWFGEQSSHNRALAEQFRELAARIDAHRRILASVTGSVEEFIGLKTPGGIYRWVNPAFAQAFGKTPDETRGLSDEQLFGQGTAQRLRVSDQEILKGVDIPTFEDQLYINQRLYHVEISKTPLTREDGEIEGIVSVTRDVTELVEQRRLREQAVRQAVYALVKTIELADPYLAGHSRLLHGFAALVAKRMHLDPAEVATLEIAANLSQIGKTAVPREILTKPDRLSPEEIRVMNRHIEYALDILGDVDFQLPVQETIGQMYERLDGSGYPAAISADAINRRARILGVCDVFCARIRPRSYRSAISPETAITVLRDHPQKYDAEVVTALDDVTRTQEGEKLLLVAATQGVPQVPSQAS